MASSTTGQKLKPLLAAGTASIVDGTYMYSDICVPGWIPRRPSLPRQDRPVAQARSSDTTPMRTTSRRTEFVRWGAPQGQAIPPARPIPRPPRPDITGAPEIPACRAAAGVAPRRAGRCTDRRTSARAALALRRVVLHRALCRPQRIAIGCRSDPDGNAAAFTVQNHHIIVTTAVAFSRADSRRHARDPWVYDERLTVGGSDSTYSWGVIVRGTASDVTARLAPQIHDHADTVGAGVSRAFSIQQDVGDYGDTCGSDAGCRNVSPALLRTLRPTSPVRGRAAGFQKPAPARSRNSQPEHWSSPSHRAYPFAPRMDCARSARGTSISLAVNALP